VAVTPEEWAEAALARKMVREDWWSQTAAVECIAAVIRAAKNEALEQAAQEFDGPAWGTSTALIAEQIRALKHKG
jgi:hypothetical protein